MGCCGKAMLDQVGGAILRGIVVPGRLFRLANVENMRGLVESVAILLDRIVDRFNETSRVQTESDPQHPAV